MSDAHRSALRRRDFGFVFQFGQLVPELSCLEYVSLPVRRAGLSRRAAEVIARKWLDRLEVMDVAAKRRATCPAARASGSRWRGRSRGARVIFADQPTGALDPLNGER